MQAIQELISQYLTALTNARGEEFGQATSVSHIGETNLLIVYPDGNKSVVGIGRLRQMISHLNFQAVESASA